MTNLIEIQPIIDIETLALQSAFLKEPNGVSLLLIAQPETAKTSTLYLFRQQPFVSYYDEITQKKLLDEFLTLVRIGQKRSLLIPDLVNCIDKQRSTRQQFLNIVKSGIDDTGVVQIATPFKSLPFFAEGLKFNMLTALTRRMFQGQEVYKTLEATMRDTGLLSRFLPFSYTYEPSKIEKLFKLIESESKTEGKINIPKIRQKEVTIPNNPEQFKRFEFISSTLGQKHGGFGLRAQTQLQRLAKANALLEGRSVVEKEDVDKILKLANWINYDFNIL